MGSPVVVLPLDTYELNYKNIVCSKYVQLPQWCKRTTHSPAFGRSHACSHSFLVKTHFTVMPDKPVKGYPVSTHLN